MELDSPAALITNAATGIGKSCAMTFAAAGYRVMAFDRDAEALVAAIADGLACLPVIGTPGDAANVDDVNAAVEQCASQLGSVDVLVACAGRIQASLLLEISEEQWEQEIAANLKGMLLFGQAAARWMMAHERPGAIVNIGCAGSGGAANVLNDAVASLTKSMAAEVKPQDIRVNAVWPGHSANPNDVALTALYLASGCAACISGAAVPVGSEEQTQE